MSNEETLENQEEEKEKEEVTEQEVEQTESSITSAEDLEKAITEATSEEIEKHDSFEDFLNAKAVAVSGSKEEPKETDSTNKDEEITDTKETVTSSDKFMEIVTREFKANGRPVQITDPEEIVQLMQYGLNYHKKMGEIAKYRKSLKALEKNGLLDQRKLNHMIDIMNGKPEAIAELVKQKDISTYDLPDLEETPYQETNHLPSELEVTFDDTVNEIKEDPQGAEVLQYLNKLDSDSFYEVYSNPNIARNLLEHKRSGLFDDAMNTLAKEKALGRVPPDIKEIDAYAYVAQQLEKSNPKRYAPQRVLGDNRNKQSNQSTNSQKRKATIPNNQGIKQAESLSGVDVLVNATSEQLKKFNNWEEFLASINKG